MVRLQLLLLPYNNMLAYSIYETGQEVERSHSQVDWDSDITGKGHAVTNVRAAELAQHS